MGGQDGSEAVRTLAHVERNVYQQAEASHAGVARLAQRRGWSKPQPMAMKAEDVRATERISSTRGSGIYSSASAALMPG